MARGQAKTYSTVELQTLFSLMDEILPFGQHEWERLAFEFNRQMNALLGNHAVARDYESLRNKFKALKNSKKPTGDPTCPWEIKRAKRLQKDIEARMSVAEMDDDVFVEADGEEEEEDNQDGPADEGDDEDEDEDGEGGGDQQAGDVLPHPDPPVPHPVVVLPPRVVAPLPRTAVILPPRAGVSITRPTALPSSVAAPAALGVAVPRTAAAQQLPPRPPSRSSAATPPVGGAPQTRPSTVAPPTVTNRIGATEAQLRAMSATSAINPSEAVGRRNRLDAAIDSLASSSTSSSTSSDPPSWLLMMMQADREAAARREEREARLMMLLFTPQRAPSTGTARSTDTSTSSSSAADNVSPDEMEEFRAWKRARREGDGDNI